MKRTNFLVCCGTKLGYPVYRSVVTDGERYFVRWNKKCIDVTKDITNGNFIRSNNNGGNV